MLFSAAGGSAEPGRAGTWHRTECSRATVQTNSSKGEGAQEGREARSTPRKQAAPSRRPSQVRHRAQLSDSRRYRLARARSASLRRSAKDEAPPTALRSFRTDVPRRPLPGPERTSPVLRVCTPAPLLPPRAPSLSCRTLSMATALKTPDFVRLRCSEETKETLETCLEQGALLVLRQTRPSR